METVLLHSCCAPCSAAIIEWMLKNDITPVVYYYNPNIFPRDEYEKRKGEITRYCEKLGIRVIAEGVETKEQADMLRSFGCHQMQGYYFSRPMPEAEYEALLKSKKALPCLVG